MLTGDLVRARVQRDTIRPTLIDPEQTALLDASDALWSLYQHAATERLPRGEVDDAVAAEIAERSRPKVLQGLAKLLADRSTFEVQSPIPPADLRNQVFALARERGPLALEAGPLARTTADAVLTEAGQVHGLDADAVRAALYADLKQNQRLVDVDVPDPTWLLHRYNVALVQALLLKALSLKVELTRPEAPRMRQLFRQVKFHRLLHRAQRRGDTLEITLDGPTSLFNQSTRYGMGLANFFPALLLQPGAWSLEATVIWTKRRLKKKLRLESADGLVSHYADRGGYRTREQEWFAERFDALNCSWKRTDGEEPVSLGRHGVLFPDFTFRDGDRVAHLEILGFWRHDDLATRIQRIADHGPGNVVVAVSRKLKGSKQALTDAPDWVIDFAEIVPARKVLDAIERLTTR